MVALRCSTTVTPAAIVLPDPATCRKAGQSRNPCNRPAPVPAWTGIRPSRYNRTRGAPRDGRRAETLKMDDIDHSLLEFQRAEHARRTAARWLAAFESALASRDAERLGALFHQDSH